MRTICQSLLTFAGATAALVLVTACNNESGTAPTTPLLSQAQAESLATTVVADVVGEIGTATMDGSAGGGVGAAAAVSAAAAAGAATAAPWLSAGAPTPGLEPPQHDGAPPGA